MLHNVENYSPTVFSQPTKEMIRCCINSIKDNWVECILPMPN